MYYTARVGDNPARRLPRMLRFSLRSFLVFLTLFCVVVANLVNSANQQRRVKTKLNDFQMISKYEGEDMVPGKPISLRARVLRPLTKYIDIDFLLPITVVQTRYLEEPSIKRGVQYTSKDFIQYLPQLRNLRTLRLTHCNVANEDLGFLTDLRELRNLDLMMSKLHEGLLTGIEGLRLERLCLARTRVDDASLASLTKMETLKSLDLTRTKVTDEGLKILANLPKLRGLVIRRTLVTREGYEAFKKRFPNISVAWEPMK